MPQFRGETAAFGFPGEPSTWAHAKKQGFGTAYSGGSRVWFTLADGILTEAFYPRTDTPQIRDLQFLFTNGRDLLLDEKRDFDHEIERMAPAQGYRITSSDRHQRLAITKEIISGPTRACILARISLSAADAVFDTLQTYVICTPHIDDSCGDNNAYVVEACGRELLAAQRDKTWLVIGASCSFSRLSCGYAGVSDGFTDISRNHTMTHSFDCARHGDVCLTGQLDLGDSRDFTLCVSFGDTLEAAVSSLFQSLSTNYEDQHRIFIHQWERNVLSRKPLQDASSDGGRLYDAGYSLLLAAEDKTYTGAFIAAPATPFGEVRNDKDGRGGYHMVWTRDMVEVAMALLAAGDTRTPLRALVNLAARQEADGNFPQNAWVDGATFSKNTQLDEVAFPVLLAARLFRDRLLDHFDPKPMVRRAVNFLLHSGPITAEERWEETGGYSPSTLATIIAACVSAATMLRAEHDELSACILEEYADYIVAHLEEWTVTTEGSLIPDVHRYFARLNPAKSGEVPAPGAVNTAELKLPDRAPGEPEYYPARNITDAGFLQLVRYGILSPLDRLIVDSLKVVDATLMHETARGKCWRRYNHDGYGQRPDGQPFQSWGQGGGWPLLTGERGHYELAAGGDYRELIRAMEQFSQPVHLLPEQIWDEPDRPEAGLFSGQATGSARPLLWAHSEYIRLLRSSVDGQVFDLIPEVANRYVKNKPSSRVEYWLPKHPIQQARRHCSLRICAEEPFQMRWSDDQWVTSHDMESSSTAIGADYCDLAESVLQAGVEFTFYWKGRGKWEGRNYRVQTEQA